MTRPRRHHVSGDKRNNAPPSHPKRGAPPQSHLKTTLLTMDPISKALCEDGVVVAGPVPPEVIQTLPDLRTSKVAGSWGRWTRYSWVSGYDLLLEEWDKVSNHEILFGSSSNQHPRTGCRKSTFYKTNPAENAYSSHMRTNPKAPNTSPISESITKMKSG